MSGRDVDDETSTMALMMMMMMTMMITEESRDFVKLSGMFGLVKRARELVRWIWRPPKRGYDRDADAGLGAIVTSDVEITKPHQMFMCGC